MDQTKGIPSLKEEYTALLKRAEEVERERDEARKAIQAFVEAPPAQISYSGMLLPISTEGMRFLIDSCSTAAQRISSLEAQLEEWREDNEKFRAEVSRLRALPAEIVKELEEKLSVAKREYSMASPTDAAHWARAIGVLASCLSAVKRIVGEEGK